MVPFILAYFDKEDTPRFPTGVLLTHCILKGVQMGSLLGTVGGGVYHAIKGKSFDDWTQDTANTSRNTAKVFGGIIVPALTLAKIYSYEDRPDAIADRAFRLKYNESQNRCDKFSFFGGLIGATVGSVYGLETSAGASVGIALGTLLHTATGSLVNPDDERLSIREQYLRSRQKIN